MRRGHEVSIRLRREELMNSRLFGSEEALARLAAERLAGKKAPQVLIGGLGLGYTLRAALAAFGPGAGIAVAELMPAVIRWAKGPLAELFAGSLDDPRVALHEGDVGALLQARRSAFDAILLDVDNGPDAMVAASNDGLYGPAGLGIARAALRPGGWLAIWSAAPDDRFAKRFEQAGFAVEDHRVRADRGKRGSRHVIWLGRRRG